MKLKKGFKMRSISLNDKEKRVENYQLNDKQKKRLIKIFKINNKIKENESENGTLFKRVLDYIPIEEDSVLLPFDDFCKFFFCGETKWNEEKGIINTLKTNINDEIHRFHYIHGHGKNGKTTFIKYFKYINKDVFNIIELNFRTLGRIPDRHNELREELIRMFNRLSLNHREKLNDVLYHIMKNYSEEKRYIDEENEKFTDFISLFDHVADVFLLMLNKITQDYKLQKITDLSSEFRLRLRECCSSSAIKTEQLFIIYLLLHLKLKGDIKKRTVFIFDNIDDILTNASDIFTAYFIPRTYHFFCDVFERYLNEEVLSKEILNNTYFIFSYRTANYVSAMHTLSPNASVEERNSFLIDAPKYVIHSNELPLNIVLQKIHFYQRVLCPNFNVSEYAKLGLFQEILNAFSKEILSRNARSLSRLWNGNNIEISRCLYSILTQEFMRINLLEEFKKYSLPIKRGTIFYYIIKYYSTISRNSAETSLNGCFKHLWDANTNKGKCDLLRLFLTYLINTGEIENIENNKDLFGKGAGLYDLLSVFKSLNYDKNDFDNVFQIFDYDIDYFDYFITCYKEINSGTNPDDIKIGEIGKRYNFSRELELFFSNSILTKSEIAVLNRIRLYANSNALFFYYIVKRHFEFVSYTVGNSNALPVMLAISDYNDITQKSFVFIPYSEIIDYINSNEHILVMDNMEYIYNRIADSSVNILKFDRLNIILNKEEYFKRTFLKTEEIVKESVLCYIKTFMNKYPPIHYCESTNFTIHKKFFYSDIISKHISYIEMIRFDIVNKKISFNNQSKFNIDDALLREINMIFVFWIEKYINLFYLMYSYLKKNMPIEIDMDSHSDKVFRSFKELNVIIDDIKKSDFKDFTLSISTKHLEIDI